MNFTINGADFTFTLEVDNNGHLTSFTATKDNATYNCSIQVTSNTELLQVYCCTPSGCTSGPCLV